MKPFWSGENNDTIYTHNEKKTALLYLCFSFDAEKQNINKENKGITVIKQQNYTEETLQWAFIHFLSQLFKMYLGSFFVWIFVLRIILIASINLISRIHFACHILDWSPICWRNSFVMIKGEYNMVIYQKWKRIFLLRFENVFSIHSELDQYNQINIIQSWS